MRAFVSPLLVELERRRESLDRRQGCVEMWTFGGRVGGGIFGASGGMGEKGGVVVVVGGEVEVGGMVLSGGWGGLSLPIYISESVDMIWCDTTVNLNAFRC